MEPYGTWTSPGWTSRAPLLHPAGRARDRGGDPKAVREELGLTVSIGVSFNKVFAKLGSDLKKPDAVTEITQENFRETIWPLPAADLLYVGRATDGKLARYGIRTIGDIAALDPPC